MTPGKIKKTRKIRQTNKQQQLEKIHTWRGTGGCVCRAWSLVSVAQRQNTTFRFVISRFLLPANAEGRANHSYTYSLKHKLYLDCQLVKEERED
jgi:hypothetical protein